jgi:hypothetical protein
MSFKDLFSIAENQPVCTNRSAWHADVKWKSSVMKDAWLRRTQARNYHASHIHGCVAFKYQDLTPAVYVASLNELEVIDTQDHVH